MRNWWSSSRTSQKSEQKNIFRLDSLKSPKIIQRDGLKFKLHALEAKQVIKSEWEREKEIILIYQQLV